MSEEWKIMKEKERSEDKNSREPVALDTVFVKVVLGIPRDIPICQTPKFLQQYFSIREMLKCSYIVQCERRERERERENQTNVN